MASGVDPAKERMMTMAEEWTLVLVKPDGVKNRHVGEVITRIERKGYQIIDLKMIEPTLPKTSYANITPIRSTNPTLLG